MAVKIDPMEQFTVSPLLGRHIVVGGWDLSFTNSALFMVIVGEALPVFSLGLRLFVAMTAGHILLEVFGSFVVQGLSAHGPLGIVVAALSFVMIVGVSALELLVCAIQAYVFALLTSLYLHDAVHLH